MNPCKHDLVVALVLATGWMACSGQADPAFNGDGGADMSTSTATLPACPPDTGTEPPHTDVVGQYSVPVAAELTPFASYPIDSITSCVRGDVVELGYKLPALLVGKEQRVSFSGPYDPVSDSLELSGDGTAACDVTASGWSCLEHFAGIVVDLEKVAEEAAGLPPAEAAARIDVAEAFGTDPIGILAFAP